MHCVSCQIHSGAVINVGITCTSLNRYQYHFELFHQQAHRIPPSPSINSI